MFYWTYKYDVVHDMSQLLQLGLFFYGKNKKVYEKGLALYEYAKAHLK